MLQCDIRCRFFPTPAFPRLAQKLNITKAEKALMKEVEFSWISDEIPEVTIQKPAVPPTIWEKALGKLPIESISFNFSAMEDQIIHPNDTFNASLTLYIK